MSTFPRSPRILKGGLVLLQDSRIERIISLQYNPETLTRSLQVQGTGEGGDRSEALRLTGPPIETYNLEAEIDATDQLAVADKMAAAEGIGPLLSALEMILYPSSSQLFANNGRAQSGTLEISPVEAPLTLFIWSKNRVVPVRITEFSITEEAFDVNLNPMRARVSLGMRVLSVSDLGFDHTGGNLYMNYQQSKERLATLYSNGSLDSFGINASNL
jgi:hypothetical protein